MLDIKVTTNGDSAVIKLIGRLDTNTTSQLEGEMKSLYSMKEIVFDLEKLDYISSSGLRILLITKKVIDNTKLIKVSEYVMSIFEATGFDTIMDIERNEN